MENISLPELSAVKQKIRYEIVVLLQWKYIWETKLV